MHTHRQSVLVAPLKELRGVFGLHRSNQPHVVISRFTADSLN
jgi:hypothetical protein